jgi:hypothetical protein
VMRPDVADLHGSAPPEMLFFTMMHGSAVQEQGLSNAALRERA